MITNDFNLEQLSNEFKNSTPFQNIVIDNFFREEVISAAYNNFPNENSPLFNWKSNDKNSKKLMCQNYELISSIKELKVIIDYLNGDEFLKILSKITGIENLVSDRTLSGGGLHQISNGGFLNIHADFNVADNMPEYNRRLNLILYFNKDWKAEYNGQLELWDTELKNCVKKIEPHYNRVVVFNTQPDGDIIAYHGHPVPLNTPSNVSRKSIALYYYTKEKPSNILKEKHKTIYKTV